MPIPHEFCALPSDVNCSSPWDPIEGAKEAEIQRLFARFIDKMKFTVPSDPKAWMDKKRTTTLSSILQACGAVSSTASLNA